MNLIITRFHSDSKHTLGILKITDSKDNCLQAFATLELPWHDNEQKISCIPASIYRAVIRNSPKFDHHLHITDVTGREYILMHKGNYTKDTSGCILVGKWFQDLNNDTVIDIANSGAAMYDLMRLIPADGIDLLIQDCYNTSFRL